MKQLSLELKTGGLLILMLVLLAVFVVLKGGWDYRRRGYEITVAYEYVAGIERGAPVRVSGVRVGEVRRVEIDFYDEQPRVLLTLYLDDSVRLGRNTRFAIRSFGLIGEKYVEVVPAPITDTPLLTAGETLGGDAPMPVERLMALGEELGRSSRDLAVTLENFFGDPRLSAEVLGALGSVRDVSEQGTRTLADMSRLSERMEEALEDYRLAAVAGRELIAESADLVSSARLAADSLHEVLAEAGKLVASSRVLVEENRPLVIQSLMNFQMATAGLVELGDEAARVVARMQRPDNTLGLLMTTPDLYRQVSGVLDETAGSLAELRSALEKAGVIIDDVHAGRGTIGKLFAGEELSDDLHALLNEATGLFSDIRARPWILLRRPRGQ